MSQQVFVGRIAKVSSGATASVEIYSVRRHPRYQKVLRTSNKLMAENLPLAKVGDWVMVAKSRPLSKRKHFVVVKIIG